MTASISSLRPSRLRQLIWLAVLLTGGAIGSAQAQQQQSAFNSSSYGPVVNSKGRTQDQAPKPPPGLPGAGANQDRSVSAERTQNADLPPTEALFDAINRGDMLASRDALNRGADLSATNVLGMTPIDLSIDLGRNNITFLLLSLRGAQPGSQPADSGAAGKLGAKPAVAAAKPKPVPPPAVRQVSVSRPVAEANRPAPGGGGTPNPQAGFLGFGG